MILTAFNLKINMEIIPSKKLFSRSVIATDADCTVRANKSLFSDCKYEVILEKPLGDYIVVQGTYAKVLGALHSKEETREAIPVFKKAAETVDDPDRTLTRGLTDNQLFCLAALSDSPRTVRELSRLMHVSLKSTRKMTLDLRREGLIYRVSSDTGEYDKELRMSAIGEQFVGFLDGEKRFREAELRFQRISEPGSPAKS